MNDAIESHESAMMTAFVRVLRAEDRIRLAKSELDDATSRLKLEINQGEHDLAVAWEGMQALMAETGEVETTLPGAANDYRIHWTSPRESVKVEDADAVPDEWCKIERKPKLAEIGKMLKGLAATGGQFPNWATLERGEAKLAWKAVKKALTTQGGEQ